MDSAAADLTKITVPDEDGAINQALTDLDARIAAWSSAMQQAQRALSQMLEHTRTRADASLEKTQTKSAPTPKSQANETPREVEDSTPSQPVPARPATADPPKVTREMLGQAPGSKATPAKPTAERAKPKEGKQTKGLAAKLKRIVGAQEAASRPVEGAEASAARIENAAKPSEKSENEKANEPPDEDEALLATLDPKVAKVIRIKRRLSNGKKSVRELLSEM